jgi:hypothetical protein
MVIAAAFVVFVVFAPINKPPTLTPIPSLQP